MTVFLWPPTDNARWPPLLEKNQQPYIFIQMLLFIHTHPLPWGDFLNQLNSVIDCHHV